MFEIRSRVNSDSIHSIIETDLYSCKIRVSYYGNDIRVNCQVWTQDINHSRIIAFSDECYRTFDKALNQYNQLVQYWTNCIFLNTIN